MLFEARVWKFGDNINTDLMMPGNAVLTRPHLTDQEAARYCMSATRPDWASQVQKGDIIIAGNNWGCGSSRPAARLFKTSRCKFYRGGPGPGQFGEGRDCQFDPEHHP
ncbi:MAG: 3-isopropylmalate dehydratase [Chloroflexi bacterium]|nr:3-isopropylmalate dehydratase [Chloroflexota bacterium]